MIGKTISRYRIVEKLGAGGMGEVYRAHDERLDRDVAVKVLPADALADESARKRFRKEALALSKLNHPNIATVYDFDTQDGIDFLVMEYVEGMTLSERVSKGALPEKEIARLGGQVADALDEAHEQGIIHRDLKPANVMVTAKGRAKVLDFGIAKLLRPEGETTLGGTSTETRGVAGTLPYMSPEQLQGETVDGRTDLYALGVLLYETSTGQPPFREVIATRLIDAILHQTPATPRAINARVSPDLERIILKCLEKDAENRYQSAKDIEVDLRRLTTSTSTPVPAAKAAAPGPILRRRRMVVGVAVAALLALALVGLLLFRERAIAPPSRAGWVQITNFTDSATSPALSPDGRMVAFIRGPGTFTSHGQVYVKILPEGDPVRLTNDPTLKMSPKFTPDGSRIAYTVPWDTWVVPVLGGEPRRLLPNASGVSWVDDRHVLYSEIKKGIHMALVTSTESRTEARDIYVPEREFGMAHRSYLSPDGKWVLVAEMARGWLPCRLLPFDGSSPGRQVGPPDAQCRSAAWSPDGKWMYLTSGAGDSFHIWRQRFPDGEPEQFTSGPTEERGIAMAPDGRSFITSVGMEQSSVWVRDSGGDRQISSTGYALSPQLSADGTKLYFMIRREVSPGWIIGELWMADLDSGRSEVLLPDILMDMYDISPDGQRVVFTTIDSEEKIHLWLAPLERRLPPRELEAGAPVTTVFGRDGDLWVETQDGPEFFLYRIKEDGSGRRKALPNPIVPNNLDVSLDGKWVIIGLGLPGSKEESWTTVAYLVDGGDSVRICDDCLVEWGPGGKYLYLAFYGWGGAPIEKAFAIPIPVGEALPRFPEGGVQTEEDALKLPGVQVIQPGKIAPGPDPSTYAFTRTTVHRNLYRIPVPR